MNKLLKKTLAILVLALTLSVCVAPAFAQEANEPAPIETIADSAENTMNSDSAKALAAAIVVGLAAAAGAVGMAFAIKGALDGTARQPEASDKLQTILMLGLVFIETAIIYALIVAILIIFVL